MGESQQTLYIIYGGYHMSRGKMCNDRKCIYNIGVQN